MNYTTEQVIALYNEYTESRFEDIDSMLRLKCGTLNQLATFEQWLLDKEKSAPPIQGQEIWVRDNILLTKWIKTRFSHFSVNSDNIPDGGIYSINQAHWDEYSLTDPNL